MKRSNHKKILIWPDDHHEEAVAFVLQYPATFTCDDDDEALGLLGRPSKCCAVLKKGPGAPKKNF